ncbi:MAG: hypothetical protein ACOCTT_00280 [archaeon]
MNQKQRDAEKGFVFSMDTAYAILIILLASAVVMMMINIPQEKTETQLHLSRTARDIQDVNQSMNGELNVKDIEDLYEGIKVNDCSNADVITVHEAVVYDGNGDIKTINTEVCPN